MQRSIAFYRFIIILRVLQPLLHDKKIKKDGRRETTYVIQGWWKLDYRLYGDVVDSLRSSATGTGEIRL